MTDTKSVSILPFASCESAAAFASELAPALDDLSEGVVPLDPGLKVFFGRAED